MSHAFQSLLYVGELECVRGLVKEIYCGNVPINQSFWKVTTEESNLNVVSIVMTFERRVWYIVYLFRHVIGLKLLINLR